MAYLWYPQHTQILNLYLTKLMLGFTQVLAATIRGEWKWESDASMGIQIRFAAKLGSCSCAKLHLRQVQLWLPSWKCNRMPAHIPILSFSLSRSLPLYISLSDVWHMLDICLGSNWLRLRLRLRRRRLHLPVDCRPSAICVYAHQAGSNGCRGMKGRREELLLGGVAAARRAVLRWLNYKTN